MSYATILIPGSGVLSAFKDSSELESALGIYLVAWFMVTFLLLWVLWFLQNDQKLIYIPFSVASLRKTVGLVILFAFLATTFLLLAAGTFTGVASFVTFNFPLIIQFWLDSVEFTNLAVSWVSSLLSLPTTLAWLIFLKQMMSICQLENLTRFYTVHFSRFFPS